MACRVRGKSQIYVTGNSRLMKSGPKHRYCSTNLNTGQQHSPVIRTGLAVELALCQLLLRAGAT